MVACSSATPVLTEAGPELDGGFSEASFDAPPDGAIPNTTASSLVFVDGVVIGDATGVDGRILQLDDVRVCVYDNGAAKFISQHALPYDVPMPLTNYPGIRQGSGLDLGSVSASVRLDVYSTTDLKYDAAWSPTSNTCDVMNCTTVGPPCVAHVSFPLTLSAGVNVVALVDDPNADAGFGVKTEQTAFVDAPFGGGPSSLWGTSIASFAHWHDGAQITAVYDDFTSDAGAGTPIPQTPIAIDDDITGKFDTHGIRFVATAQQTSDQFAQTLDSIAYVANAAVTPPDFYDVRENFVFALVGDPNDPTAVNEQGGRNMQFNRKGLHIAAVPYATPHETD